MASYPRLSGLEDTNFIIKGSTLFTVIVFFFVIFFFVLVICLCRLSYNRGVERAAPSDGLDGATINQLPVMMRRQGGAPEKEASSECSICLGLYRDEERVKVLPGCHHFYHSECVDRWLQTQPTCPLCRSSLRNDSGLPRRT